MRRLLLIAVSAAGGLAGVTALLFAIFEQRPHSSGESVSIDSERAVTNRHRCSNS
jgi:hypothetical protein